MSFFDLAWMGLSDEKIDIEKKKRWPDIARPVIILTCKMTTSDYLSDLTIELLKELQFWNSRKKTNKVKVMLSIIGLSTLSASIYDNGEAVRSAALNTFFFTNEKYSLDDSFANIMTDNVIFELTAYKEERLIKDFFYSYGSPFMGEGLNKGLNHNVSVLAEKLMSIYSQQRTWLNPSVVLISDGAIPVEVQRGLDQWKNESDFMFRLFSLSADNTYDNKNTFSEDGIDELAKAIVQYVEPKPVPRIPKKSIGDALAVQLPVLEGAMYDNE